MNEDSGLMEGIMQLIMYGGDAKGKAVEAIRAAKKFDFDVAKAKLIEANHSLSQAHHAQTNMLTQEARGDSIEVTLLMNAITFIDLAKEVIDVYKKLQERSA